ncbi:hypothetical protein G5I_11806 [Acromyrmex echinatior]|uniref:Uncharacterized protein n=1 Tax=Acromyrmex echinatior TaxID=103372 RepID=F4X0M6_ACREC|nr:hypothetical protein G5I_11806 [Acromyrmex echinatior]
MKAKISRKELDDLFDEGARFRDTSQQIHKQWQADPARAFPTVGGNVTTNSPSPASGELSTPNSTPSPSPSPTNHQITPFRRGTFDAAEGLMLCFSLGFYVGSMKNVPPPLLAGKIPPPSLSPPYAPPHQRLAAFADILPVHFKAATFAAKERL